MAMVSSGTASRYVEQGFLLPLLVSHVVCKTVDDVRTADSSTAADFGADFEAPSSGSMFESLSSFMLCLFIFFRSEGERV